MTDRDDAPRAPLMDDLYVSITQARNGFLVTVEPDNSDPELWIEPDAAHALRRIERLFNQQLQTAYEEDRVARRLRAVPDDSA